MLSPLRYRPRHLDDPDTEWADNPLSNAMAWASQTAPLKPMCGDDRHWSQRATKALATDCSCCLLWRGLTLGCIAGLAAGLLLRRAK
jgi:hypothetical protein